ncbi:MAG: S8 family serine peptidase [Deltaproteobacteria bacterium]
MRVRPVLVLPLLFACSSAEDPPKGPPPPVQELGSPALAYEGAAPTEIELGPRPSGSTLGLDVVVTNVGAGPLTIAGVDPSADFDARIDAGGQQTVTVELTFDDLQTQERQITFTFEDSDIERLTFTVRWSIRTETISIAPPSELSSLGGLAFTPKPGLDSTLSRLVDARPEEFPPDVTVIDGRVQFSVQVAPSTVAIAVTALEGAGAEVTSSDDTFGLIQAWAPIDDLETIAALEVVPRVTNPPRAVPALASALLEMDVAPWHGAGFDGRDVRVGIIDVGFAGFDALVGEQLPSGVEFMNFVDEAPNPNVPFSASNHGTAVAEIVHGAAPGAELYLAEISRLPDLVEAVNWFLANDIHVINTSLEFFNVGPGDGSGIVNDIVAVVADAGVVWVTAAGNQRRTHWFGAATFDAMDRMIFPGSANQPVNYLPYCLPMNYPITGYLRWSDWGNVDQDLDLHVVKVEQNGTLTFVASSSDPQNGGAGQTPTETLSWAVDDPCVGSWPLYGFAVTRGGATGALDVELFSLGLEVATQVFTQSITTPGDSPRAISVAAVEPFPPYTVAFYSAEGPTHGPGGVMGGGFGKPDISAYTDINLVSTGATLFNGTSAAAPFVAGAAADVLSADGDLSPAEVRGLLVEWAPTLGQPARHGAGRVVMGPLLVPLGAPSIVGPADATAWATNELRAQVGPMNATAPITYLWSATGNPDVMPGATPDIVHYRWTEAGTHTVTLRVNNPGSAEQITTSQVVVTGLSAGIGVGSCADGIFGLDVTLDGTTAGTNYGVYHSTDLQTWAVSSVGVTGAGSSTVFTDCGGPGWDPDAGGQAFYRGAVEDDPDGDGLGTGYEITILGTDPLLADTDGNGTDDGDEDFDLDGLGNGAELNMPGTVYFDPCRAGTSDPNAMDSDGDGTNDDADAFPLDPAAFADADCNGQSDVPLMGASTSRPPVTAQ